MASPKRRLVTEVEPGQEWYALLLCCGAGLATTIGAAMAFCVNTNDNRVFAICLAVSAGVMTYVSFVEIIVKAQESFLEQGFSDSDAFTLSTVVFFGGLLISVLLEHVALLVFRRMRTEEKTFEHGSAEGVMQAHRDPDKLSNAIHPDEVEAPVASEQVAIQEEAPPAAQPAAQSSQEKPLSGQERLDMLQMAAFSGFAIAMHNFPEGLATFVAALADPSFGPPMAFAIAIHNIPEGLAVAAPILKATNSKWKAFAWAFLSGMSEPIGALLGWIVLREIISPMTFAVLFGLIGGVMIHICFKKLIPTALKYDPENRYTSYAFFCGMGIMALSLIAFAY
eukprot:gb/GFBE01062035.1/.p1 GENE.gb/GFBE01062035.1/~~gb/GFBE01062035.1/.p1  ORF type:complete len:338 (+),score=71.26 gb/GFBE01062035.1/:1-1014(+)